VLLLLSHVSGCGLTPIIPISCTVRIIPDCRHQSSIDPSRSPRESPSARTVCAQFKPKSSKEEK
jgi:hypothetical protein